MAARWLRSSALLSCAALLLAGCSTDPPAGSATASPPGQGADAADLIERARAARAGNDPAEFADLVSAASRACPDASAAQRLGEVAAIAARWSSAVLEGRPKAQAVTEAQLATVDWDALADACVAS